MKKIAVFFGGKSAEHDISIITAYTPIIDALHAINLYEVVPIYITHDGRYISHPEMTTIDFFKNNNYQDTIESDEYELLFDINNCFQVRTKKIFSQWKNINVVFSALHGTYGEDGSLMGLLRMAHVPFVGCNMDTAVVAMDKVLTKQVLHVEQFPIVPYVWFTHRDWLAHKDALIQACEKLHYPVFIKPVHLGSSIGITKANDTHELISGIEVALHYDHKVLVEKSIEHLIELTLPIIGNEKEQITAHLEKPLHKKELFDFNDKYMHGGKKGDSQTEQAPYSELPAQIDESLEQEAKEMGIAVYRVLGAQGIMRIDFLYDTKEKKLYVNEINILPGSLYAHNWRQAGVSSSVLVEKLINLAYDAHEKRNAYTYKFQSSVLNK
ncbi:MAG: D-alanine--D-alanine ligase [Alphaproteobacteria bacterium]|nr:D-alanine--D-alanine ligase [Alphaproteobacteria bacterium]